MKRPSFFRRRQPKVTPGRVAVDIKASTRQFAKAIEDVAPKIEELAQAIARPKRRRLPSGKTVPAAETGRTWVDLVHPGPDPTGVRRPFVVDAPPATVEVLVAASPSKRAQIRARARARVNERQKISRGYARDIIRNRLATPQPSAAVRRGNVRARLGASVDTP